MDNNVLIEDLKKEIAELRKLYAETSRTALMYSNMLHFILNNEVPESKLAELRNNLK